MDEKLKEKTKDAQTFWHYKHQRVSLNLAVAALMIGPKPLENGDIPEEYLKQYIPLAKAIDHYTCDVMSDLPKPWW